MFCFVRQKHINTSIFSRTFIINYSQIKYEFEKKCEMGDLLFYYNILRLYLFLLIQCRFSLYNLVQKCMIWMLPSLHSRAQSCHTRLDYLSNMTGVLLEAGTVGPSREHRFIPVFGGVHVAHLFSFLCLVVFYLLVFALCLVYPMLHVSLNCLFLIAPSVFSNVYLQ